MSLLNIININQCLYRIPIKEVKKKYYDVEKMHFHMIFSKIFFSQIKQ